MNSVFQLPQGLTPALFALISLFYFIGTGFNILLRAGFAYRSDVNVYPTRFSFVTKNWDTILIRVCVYGFGFFYAWTLHNDLPTKIAEAFGVAAGIATWLTVPVGLGSSGGFGFIIDVLLDSLQSVVASTPWLKWANVVIRGRVPTYDPRVVNLALIQQQKDNK